MILGSLENEEVYLCLWYQRESIMVGSTAAGDWNRKLREHVFGHKHNTERAIYKWGKVKSQNLSP